MTSPISWSPLEAFRATPFTEQAADGAVRCVGFAICAEDGRPARSVFQGEQVHVFFELEAVAELETPVGWIEIRDATGRLVHGRSSAQLDASPPETAPPGSRLQFTFVIALALGPGEYSIAVGLSSTDQASYAAYQVVPRRRTEWPDGYVPLRERSGKNHMGPLTEERFLERLREHCRIVASESLVVGLDDEGRQAFSGLADLPGRCQVAMLPAQQPDRTGSVVSIGSGNPAERRAPDPTIIHVTHPKAGSQWVAQILADCAPDRIVSPRLRAAQLLSWAVRAGMIYPTAYVTRMQLDTVRLPEDSRVFVVVRDLRDTMISLYFSYLKSHSELDRSILDARTVISRLPLEEGLLYMMDGWLSPSARIQLSWKEAGFRLVRYEDLIENDVELFEQLLIDECGLNVSAARLKSVVLANRFERYTQGRQRGQEETGHHYRKGVAGDWVNYFTPAIKQAFKARYGGLLVATGYERDLSW